MADVGNEVLCVDVDPVKVQKLQQGECPIYEPGLQELLKANLEGGRLRFTLDAETGVNFGEFQFIAVGTPPDEDGSADLQYVLKVAETIGRYMQAPKIIISKSTVPVGTADKVREATQRALSARGVNLSFDVVSNPEFLKEGAALGDFNKPDRIIIGTDNPHANQRMHALYAPFNRNHDKIVAMDVRSAELTKYAANAMLATKISFMNELANLADKVGADIEQVRIGIGSDPRIGYQFIYPGCGYGGSCFPKDVKALIRSASEVGYQAKVLQAVEAVNEGQKRTLFDKLEAALGSVQGKTIALWGLAFKPRTDDMREAPSRVLMESLWAAGAQVRAYDPVAMPETRHLYGNRPDLYLASSPEDAANGADALALVTEWRVFQSPNFDRLKGLLKQPVIVDGRNQYDPHLLKQLGFEYRCVGRPFAPIFSS